MKQVEETPKVPVPPYNLCVAARDEAMLERGRKKKKHIAKQVACIKKILGKEFLDQCTYNESSDDWTICRQRFICGPSSPFFNNGGYILVGSSEGGSLHLSGFDIHSLADLGEYLEKQERLEQDKKIEIETRKLIEQTHVTVEPVPREPWYKRWFGL